MDKDKEYQVTGRKNYVRERIHRRGPPLKSSKTWIENRIRRLFLLW